jgi:hypothetical protein
VLHCGKLQALLENIKQVCKGMEVANTLAFLCYDDNYSHKTFYSAGLRVVTPMSQFCLLSLYLFLLHFLAPSLTKVLLGMDTIVMGLFLDKQHFIFFFTYELTQKLSGNCDTLAYYAHS